MKNIIKILLFLGLTIISLVNVYWLSNINISLSTLTSYNLLPISSSVEVDTNLSESSLDWIRLFPNDIIEADTWNNSLEKINWIISLLKVSENNLDDLIIRQNTVKSSIESVNSSMITLDLNYDLNWDGIIDEWVLPF